MNKKSILIIMSLLPVLFSSVFFLQTVVAAAPVLSLQSVSPTTLHHAQGESFSFSVTYTHTDNTTPEYVRVSFANVAMDEWFNAQIGSGTSGGDPLDQDYTDGKIYTYTINEGAIPETTGPGIHNYYFTTSASDNISVVRYPSNVTEFFSFEIINAEPTLTDLSVNDPIESNSGEQLIFSVNYTHTDNTTPSYVRVSFSNVAMDDWFNAQIGSGTSGGDPLDQNYTDGKVYTYAINEGQLPETTGVGSHSYYFTTSDSDTDATIIRSPETGYYTFQIEATTLPNITLETPTNDSTLLSGTIIDVSVSDDNLDTILFNWDGDSNTTWSGDYQTVLPTGDGYHSLYVYANDSSDNWSSRKYVFTTDDTAPTIVITNPTNTSYTTDTVMIDITGDAVHYWYYISGIDATNQSWTSSISRSLTDGTYTLHIYGNDTVGNVAHTSITFTMAFSTTTTITTTTPTTTQEETSESSTTSNLSPFPGLFSILAFLSTITAIHRRNRK